MQGQYCKSSPIISTLPLSQSFSESFSNNFANAVIIIKMSVWFVCLSQTKLIKLQLKSSLHEISFVTWIYWYSTVQSVRQMWCKWPCLAGRLETLSQFSGYLPTYHIQPGSRSASRLTFWTAPPPKSGAAAWKSMWGLNGDLCTSARPSP